MNRRQFLLNSLKLSGAILLADKLTVLSKLGVSPAEAFQVTGSGISSEGAGCAGGTDGLIGSSNITSNQYLGGANILRWAYFTPVRDGEFTYAHGGKNGTGNYRIGLWSQSGTLLVDTGLQSGGGDGSVAAIHAAISSYCLVSSTTYIVGLWIVDGFVNTANSGYSAGNSFYYQTLSTFGDFTPSTDGAIADKLLGVQLNNTASDFE